MENEIIENTSDIKLENKIDPSLIIAISILWFIFTVGIVFFAYKQGCEDTKRIYKEPQLHITLVPDYGPLTVIPVKLTDKGLTINFSNTFTNLKAIGIDMPNVKK